jgi:hypothetical protein
MEMDPNIAETEPESSGRVQTEVAGCIELTCRFWGFLLGLSMVNVFAGHCILHEEVSEYPQMQ